MQLDANVSTTGLGKHLERAIPAFILADEEM